MNVWVSIYRKYGWKNSKFKKRAVGRIGSTVRFDRFDLMVRIGSVKWFELVQFGSPVRFGLFKPVQWFIGSNRFNGSDPVRIFFFEPTRTSQAYRFKLDCWPVQIFFNRFVVRIRINRPMAISTSEFPPHCLSPLSKFIT